MILVFNTDKGETLTIRDDGKDSIMISIDCENGEGFNLSIDRVSGAVFGRGIVAVATRINDDRELEAYVGMKMDAMRGN